MNGDIGKNFLKEYQFKTQPLLETYLANEITKAKEFGKVPLKAISTFKDLALEGKRVRGALMVLGYLSGNGKNIDMIHDVSLFIEIFHAGLLVQDDFMDKSDSRRGMKSIHKVFEEVGKSLKVKCSPEHYGVSIATAVGDEAFYLSMRKLLNSNLSKDTILKSYEVLIKYAVRLIYGQMLDMTITGTANISEEDVMNILWTKSGEYTCLLPLEIGYVLSEEADPEKLRNITEYAKCLGWAFQIQDDYLGTFGNEEITGKPITSDLMQGKNTLFALQLRKIGSAKQNAIQERLLGNENITKDDVYTMREVYESCGVKDLVMKKGWSYIESGKKYIPSITSNTHLQGILESLLYFMMGRTK